IADPTRVSLHGSIHQRVIWAKSQGEISVNMGLMRATKSGETRNLKCGESRATSQSHRRIDNKIGRRRDPERQTARVDGNAISLGARPTGHNASKNRCGKALTAAAQCPASGPAK